jgi:hypothetical protein
MVNSFYCPVDMSESRYKSRFYGVTFRLDRDGQKRYTIVFTVSPFWPAEVRERCDNKRNMSFGTFETEEAAASAVDQ